VDPPFVAGASENGYDESLAAIKGRFWYVQLKDSKKTVRSGSPAIDSGVEFPDATSYFNSGYPHSTCAPAHATLRRGKQGRRQAQLQMKLVVCQEVC
jgi:hypothetical protein